MNQSRRFNKGVIVLLHVLAWLLFFSLPLLLHPPFNRHGQANLRPPSFDLYHTITDLVLVGIFYLNAYVLLPHFINKKKIGRFLLVLLLIFLGFTLFNFMVFRWLVGFHPMYGGVIELDHYHHPGPGRLPGSTITIRHFRPSTVMFIFKEFFPFLLILVSSTAYRMVIDRIRSDKLAKEKENANLKTELMLLRSQISPHFMFNVLNNMVSLARKHSDQLESSLIKLSSLMRYMYFEARQDKVPLSKEMDYLQSYIDLQIQRFRETVTVKVDLQTDPGNHVIEPMLLIPFVENAFKHGTALIEDAEIDIMLQVTGDVLCFFVSNKFGLEGKEIKDKTAGIGLKNVKRRLNLLYGNQYHLDIVVREDWHTVSLQLNLN